MCVTRAYNFWYWEPAFALTPENVHVLARRMVDVSMIVALLCFTVGRGRLGTVNKEEMSPADKQKI